MRQDVDVLDDRDISVPIEYRIMSKLRQSAESRPNPLNSRHRWNALLGDSLITKRIARKSSC
jgi:hypothetical protein